MVENVCKMLHKLIELGNCINFLNIGFPLFQLVPFFLLMATLKCFNNSYLFPHSIHSTVWSHGHHKWPRQDWFTTFGHQFDYPPPFVDLVRFSRIFPCLTESKPITVYVFQQFIHRCQYFKEKLAVV